MNKIIIGFIVILLLFSAFVVFQMDKTATPPSKVSIDTQTFSVNVAKTTEQQQQGLSGKKSIPQDQGMLFVFTKADKYPFWMKGMQFPLDIIFIKDTKIVTMYHNVPVPSNPNASNLPVYTPTQPANYVLEINAGLAQKYDFQNGDDVKVTLK